MLRCERVAKAEWLFGIAVRNTAHRYLTREEAANFEAMEQRLQSIPQFNGSQSGHVGVKSPAYTFRLADVSFIVNRLEQKKEQTTMRSAPGKLNARELEPEAPTAVTDHAQQTCADQQ